jgi:hypothetical protein
MTDATPSRRGALDADTVEMLRTSLRHVLTDASATPLTDRLAELGWDEVLALDAPSALAILFDIKGDTLSTADALGPRLAQVLADATGDASLAEATVTLPSPFGPTSVSGASIALDGMAFTAPVAGTHVVFALGDGAVVVPADGLTMTPIHSHDQALALVRVTGTAATGTAARVDAAAWAHVVAEGRRLLACELVGIARHVVTMAVEYTGARVQYGKPIGVFQALQHRLASAHSLVVGAGHLTDEAGWSGDAWAATVAKCLAGRAAENACTQAQQCFGAIGFTWEHELHHYIRRTYTLDRLLGDWRGLEHEIGEHLQELGAAPAIGTL